MNITITEKSKFIPHYYSEQAFPICNIGVTDTNRLILKIYRELFFFDTKTWACIDGSSIYRIRELQEDEIINIKLEG